jgi:SAM-dependent methyltransferase
MTIEGKVLEGAFASAQPDHFAWQTEAPYVAEQERELVRAAFEPLGSNVLDAGCGEGATLYHLGQPENSCGLDLFEGKVAFARARLPKCRFEQGSVYAMPFEAGTFDHVIARDLIHHLDAPERFISECRRVLRSGGRLDVLEPSRNNPLIFIHAMLNRAERGELRSTPDFLRGLVAGSLRIVAVQALQALPIHRLIYHPELGSPALARRPLVQRCVAALESWAANNLPERFHAYVHLRALRD